MQKLRPSPEASLHGQFLENPSVWVDYGDLTDKMASTHHRFERLEVQGTGKVTVFWKVLPTTLHGITSQETVTFMLNICEDDFSFRD